MCVYVSRDILGQDVMNAAKDTGVLLLDSAYVSSGKREIELC